MATNIFTEIPQPEKMVIGRIKDAFRLVTGRGLELKECVKEGNSAGYYCDFVYHGFDPRKLNARKEPKEARREFHALWTLPHLQVQEIDDKFGLRIVFHNGDPAFSEGYSFGESLPLHLTEFSEFVILEIYEDAR